MCANDARGAEFDAKFACLAGAASGGGVENGPTPQRESLAKRPGGQRGSAKLKGQATAGREGLGECQTSCLPCVWLQTLKGFGLGGKYCIFGPSTVRRQDICKHADSGGRHGDRTCPLRRSPCPSRPPRRCPRRRCSCARHASSCVAQRRHLAAMPGSMRLGEGWVCVPRECVVCMATSAPQRASLRLRSGRGGGVDRLAPSAWNCASCAAQLAPSRWRCMGTRDHFGTAVTHVPMRGRDRLAPSSMDSRRCAALVRAPFRTAGWG